MEVKRLNTQHFWGIVSMIRKGGKEAILKLQDLNKKGAAPEDEKAAELERGMIIFDVAMEYAEKDLQALFADLAGMTLEEYKEAPYDLTLDIIEQLAEQEDLASFFKRAASFTKKFLPSKQTV